MSNRDDVPYDADLAGRIELPLALLAKATKQRTNLERLHELISEAREEAKTRERENRPSPSEPDLPASTVERSCLHEVDAQDVLRGFRLEAVSYWRRRSRAKFAIPLAYLASIFIALFFMMDNALLLANLTTIFLALYLLSYAAHWFLVLPKKAQTYAAHPHAMGTFQSAWTDARWTFGNLRWTLSGKWEDLDGYLESREYLLLFITPRSMIVFPVASLAPEQLADIRSLLARAKVSRYR